MKRGNKVKFGKETAQRKALSKSLVTALLVHGKIKTTEARAKILSRTLQKLITLAKKSNLASRRQLLTQIGKDAVQNLTTKIILNLKDKNSGYIKTTRLGQRKSDGAPMFLIEFNI